MSDITLTTTAGKLAVRTPFSEAFNAGALDLAGKFDRDARAWRFDARDEDQVRALLVRVFGHDDRPPAQTVTVQVALDTYLGGSHGPHMVFAGRTVATRPSRDEKVRLSGATVVTGGFDYRGGSVKNPRLEFDAGTVLQIRDVPAGHADLNRLGVTIIEQGIDRAALADERAQLLARLAEIDKLLDADHG